MLNFLKNEGISPKIIAEIERFRADFPVEDGVSHRIPVPRYLYYGKDIWEEAITALLCGENLLLVGPKATGKNVLAENLAAVFGRPSWDVSFYINTDAATLLGTDTFADGAVTLRKGPIYQCAEKGGFGILDEINMAKNESLAVLHATLDFRRSIDMPGYERITMHDATRFIATMNYGYAGTRELNEALASRFVVIDMPAITTDGLIKLLCREYPKLRPAYAGHFAGLFQDIQKKCDGGELSTKPLDLRGLVAAVRLMQPTVSRSSSGALDVGRVWRGVYLDDDKVFTRVLQSDPGDLCVDILLAASASQLNRQELVSAQGYMIAEALTRCNIPVRVSSFCSLSGYTILTRYRDYFERDNNRRIFHFFTAGCNRDGLALRALCQEMESAPCEHKIVILLSDARPNDIIRFSQNGRYVDYVGDNGILNTAAEVRSILHRGIAVICVFTGDDEDVPSAHTIYGRNFARIRHLEQFADTVGTLIQNQIRSF